MSGSTWRTGQKAALDYSRMGTKAKTVEVVRQNSSGQRFVTIKMPDGLVLQVHPTLLTPFDERSGVKFLRRP